MSGSAKSGSLSLVFPHPSAELLVKGLEALGVPPEDGVWGPGDVCSVGSGNAHPAEFNPLHFRVRGISSIVPLVNTYIKELELFNAVFDLVGADPKSDQGRSDLVVRHILDSLAPWKELCRLCIDLPGSASPKIADAGSGAGFPGIPLSIVFPDIHFTLIERMTKRCSFLENCKAILGLTNVSIVNVEVEKARAGAFDIVVFRAFRPLDHAMIKTLLALTSSTGFLAAYKAKRDKIEEEMSAISADVDGWKIVTLSVPFLEHEERHLVLTSSKKILNQGN